MSNSSVYTISRFSFAFMYFFVEQDARFVGVGDG
jgi:hypothetical protein